MLIVKTVCVAGMGSSLLFRLTAEKAFKALGIDAQVQAVDLGQANNMEWDVAITSPSIAKALRAQEGAIIIPMTNYMDVNVMKEKISEALSRER